MQDSGSGGGVSDWREEMGNFDASHVRDQIRHNIASFLLGLALMSWCMSGCSNYERKETQFTLTYANYGRYSFSASGIHDGKEVQGPVAEFALLASRTGCGKS
jgi:hypothetical protein